MQGDRSRILILTAGFGEGHNSAAANLATALADRAVVEIADPCHSGSPRINRQLQNFYRFVTTHAPSVWKRIYDSTENQDFSHKSLPFMRPPEQWLAEKIDTFQPDALVSTYPLYPYFCDRILQNHPSVPVFTVITDSIEINATWRKAPSNHFLLTDELTRRSLLEKGMPAGKLVTTGFPVHPRFADGETLAAEASVSPFKVLYFPTAKKPHVRRFMLAALEAHPDVSISVVLGRNVRTLYQRAASVKQAFPGRVRLHGWTRRVPELLMDHHLVIGKAGGATVHEAIAAACPMLIHHLVPGQEEGNLALLNHVGAGQLTESPLSVTKAIAHMLEDDAGLWRQMKGSLATLSRPAAANDAASFILSNIQ